jgi:Tol biopolymer transport system component
MPATRRRRARAWAMSVLVLAPLVVAGCDDAAESARQSCVPFAAVQGLSDYRQFDVYSFTTTGSVRRITHDKRSFQPVVSPDGRWMVITKGGRGSWQETEGYATTSLQVSEPDGTIVSRIPTEERWNDSGTAVSPDGKQLAFVRSRGEQARLMVADTTDPRPRVLNRALGRGAEGQGMAWSPDGRRIAVATEWIDDVHVLVLDAQHGDVLRDLTVPNRARHIAWSPDSSKLLLSDSNYESPYPIAEVDVASGTSTPVVSSDATTTFTRTNAEYSSTPGRFFVLRHEQSVDPLPQRLELIDRSGTVFSSTELDRGAPLVGGLRGSDCAFTGPRPTKG